MIDKVVKDLVEMKFQLTTGKSLKFGKLSKTGKRSRLKQQKTSNKIRNPDKVKPRERADQSNIMKELRKATKQNKRMENSKEKTEYTQNLVFDSVTETACDLEAGGEKTKDDLILKKETKGAEATENTACDLKHEPAREGGSQLSILQPRATQGRETQQRAVRKGRKLEEAAATVTYVAVEMSCGRPRHPGAG